MPARRWLRCMRPGHRFLCGHVCLAGGYSDGQWIIAAPHIAWVIFRYLHATLVVAEKRAEIRDLNLEY